MDLCKNCIVRGDFEACRKTECNIRESWIFREAVEQAHMAGQIDFGCKSPGYSNARAYFDETYNDEWVCPCGCVSPISARRCYGCGRLRTV